MIKRLLILFFSCYVLAVNATDREILVYGDSLSAGYGIPMDRSWVTLLQQRLKAQGYNYQVINASISGDTSRGASARLNNLLEMIQPEIAILELGGNDGLRGLAIEEMHQNLAGIIEKLQRRNTRILLVPMQLPPNYGRAYNTKFQRVYEKLSNTHGVLLSGFILDGIALDPDLMQDDGIHPKVEAQMMMLDNIWPGLKTLLEK